MKKKILALIMVLMFSVVFTGCAQEGNNPEETAKTSAEVGTLAFVANGEDFVRQGFTSKDGWAISFDHVYINLADVTAYQTNPPYDPESGKQIESDKSVTLKGVHTVDLAEGDENAEPILLGKVEAPIGHYNAISWKLANASKGVAQGNNLVIIGKAEKEGQVVDFNIKVDKQYQYLAGEYVGDERKGIVEADKEADLEMTFHFDHIFGDIDTPADDGLNIGALGFDSLARLAKEGKAEIDMAGLKQGLTADEYSKWLEILPTLGHVGEGHAHAEEL